MNRKNQKRHIAYEGLVMLGVSALVLYIFRLWPLLVLALLGMPPVTVWLILSTRRNQAPDEPKPMLASHEQNEAFGRIQAQISALVRAEHPNARWISRAAPDEEDREALISAVLEPIFAPGRRKR